ncbi:MAG: tagatose 1,6-diphosphate aldolase [Anaerolineae bacterium]
MKQPISLGKYRSLQQCSTSRGAISVLALDQRGNLRQLLNASDPKAVSYDQMVGFKTEVIAALSSSATAVLLDPEFGAAQCIASGALAGSAGLLVAAEAAGYSGDPTARQTKLLPDWSIAKTARMGANAVKLLAYYHPDSPSAAEIEALIRQVAADCAAAELPLFLEPLSYSLDPDQPKLPADERRRVVIETARRLTPLGADILKAEFPLDVSAEAGESRWYDACAELTAASVIPWVLLSAGVAYEVFLKQVTVACQTGASGVAVGRAVWQEAAKVQGAERSAFLASTARERMQRVTALCDALATPWMSAFETPVIADQWAATY